MSRLAAPLVLASASPRRKELLQRVGIGVEVVTSGVDEDAIEAATPESFALEAARAKAAAVAGRLQTERPVPFVLAGDTVVAVDGDILGKPADDADAHRMIRMLSNRWHGVTTVVVLARPGEGVLGYVGVTTSVLFRRVSDADAERYVATGEPHDKAGAYGIQGAGGELVAKVQGCYSNVVGLPTTDTLRLLARHGALRSWP